MSLQAAGLLARPLPDAFPVCDQWQRLSENQGLTAAGTAQDSHLIPI